MITKKGTITSAKMMNTVTITVHRHIVHPIYKKSYRLSKKFLADTNGLDLHLGDEVLIQECRPLSKRKHFKVMEVLKKAARVSDLKEEKALKDVLGTPIEEKEEKVSPSAS